MNFLMTGFLFVFDHKAHVLACQKKLPLSGALYMLGCTKVKGEALWVIKLETPYVIVAYIHCDCYTTTAFHYSSFTYTATYVAAKGNCF